MGGAEPHAHPCPSGLLGVSEISNTVSRIAGTAAESFVPSSAVPSGKTMIPS